MSRGITTVDVSLLLVIALLDAVVTRIGFALIFGVWLQWGYLSFWFGAVLAELDTVIIGIIFYFVGDWKGEQYKGNENLH